jgi:hypothetical protein
MDVQLVSNDERSEQEAYKCEIAALKTGQKTVVFLDINKHN